MKIGMKYFWKYLEINIIGKELLYFKDI